MSLTPVKPERHDEAEIRELAAKLAEEQKKKLSMPTPMVMTTLNGPSHLARSNNIKMVANNRMDQDSVMGR